MDPEIEDEELEAQILADIEAFESPDEEIETER